MFIRKETIICLMLVLSSSHIFASEALEREIQGYIEIFSGDVTTVDKAVYSELRWTGITDERLYDTISEKLMVIEKFKPSQSGEASWPIKALAFPGKVKYKATLETIYNRTDLGTIKRHIKDTWEWLEIYSRWNPQISKNMESVPADRLKQARIINMLDSTDRKLRAVGIKRARKFFPRDNEILDKVVQLVAKAAKQPVITDKDGLDLWWYSNILIESEDTDRIAKLEEIKEGAVTKRARTKLSIIIKGLKNIRAKRLKEKVS